MTEAWVYKTRGHKDRQEKLGYLNDYLSCHPLEENFWYGGFPLLGTIGRDPLPELITSLAGDLDDAELTFPLHMLPFAIPLSIVMEAHPYFLSGQSYVRLAERGGVGLEEVYRAFRVKHICEVHHDPTDRRNAKINLSNELIPLGKVVGWYLSYYKKLLKESEELLNPEKFSLITFKHGGYAEVSRLLTDELVGKSAQIMGLTVRYKNEKGEWVHTKLINEIVSSKG